jgi:hypothetical protein
LAHFIAGAVKNDLIVWAYLQESMGHKALISGLNGQWATKGTAG